MKQKKSTLVLLSVVLLSGCSVKNTFTRKTELNYASIGAMVCGGAGLLVGAVIGQNIKHSLIGGASGAALCGGIGYYLDQQEDVLRQKLKSSGVRVVREGERIRLVMPGHIIFTTNSARLDRSFYNVLEAIQVVLNEYDKTGILVQGHTDDLGSEKNNMKLSKRRADAVAAYLVFKGVKKSRILVQGMGETFPLSRQTTSKARQLNRRVELIIKSR